MRSCLPLRMGNTTPKVYVSSTKLSNFRLLGVFGQANVRCALPCRLSGAPATRTVRKHTMEFPSKWKHPHVREETARDKPYDRKKNVLTRYHICSQRWTIAFYFVASGKCPSGTISVLLADEWATRIKTKIEPLFTLRAMAALTCLKMHFGCYRSAVFNILMIIALTGALAGKVISFTRIHHYYICARIQ